MEIGRCRARHPAMTHVGLDCLRMETLWPRRKFHGSSTLAKERLKKATLLAGVYEYRKELTVYRNRNPRCQ